MMDTNKKTKDPRGQFAAPLARCFIILVASLGLSACGGSDGEEVSTPVVETPQVDNSIPVADASDDQQVPVGSEVLLFGGDSFDADNDPLSYLWSFTSRPDNSHAQLIDGASPDASFIADVAGSYVMSLTVDDGQGASNTDSVIITGIDANHDLPASYAIVDTNQTLCYHSSTGLQTACVGLGHDGDYLANVPEYSVSQDGLTVTDKITQLIWQQSSDINGDGQLDYADKLYQSEALSYCQNLSISGRDDWRLPSIKEAYSLILFSGKDASSYQGTDTSTLVPFLATQFDWAFGDIFTQAGIDAGDRIIDAQYASSTLYQSTTMNGNATMFGVNYIDGRIKGYPTKNKKYYVRCVSANPEYGINQFVDNANQTITDNATALMWQQNDSGPVNWDQAVAQCETASTAQYDDWRLPNAKELQSIVDYQRSPDSHNSAAIDPMFNASAMQNEAGNTDWGSYWTSTSHIDNAGEGSNGVYISFGRSLGYMQGAILDVHGAGAQRSDDKLDVSREPGASSATGANGVFYYKGPQGDILRTNNQFRCVRNVTPTNEVKIATDGSKNILLFVGDDIGVDNISGYRAQPDHSANTPVIDSLAAKGVLFSNVWSNPLCSPSRASILTGRHPFRHGVTHPGNNTRVLKSSEETIAEALSAVGYQTALFGKWHLGEGVGELPTDQGFDYYSGSLPGLENYFDWQKTQVNAQDGVVTTHAETGYATEVVTTEALNWINQSSGPWFVEVAFNAPHSPYHVPPAGDYHGVTLTGSVGDACNANPSNDAIEDCYRAAAETMDTYMGRMLSKMDASTLANTLIIFVGDNGTPQEVIIEQAGLPFTQIHGKGTLYQGGINVPLVISGGINMGVDASVVAENIQVQDLFSTVLAIANTSSSTGGVIDGLSLLGYLDNQTPIAVKHTELFSELANAAMGIDRWAITDGKVKYINNEGVDECYDLSIDLGETLNLYGQAASSAADQCQRLKSNRPQD
jgi:arylsulfatase A-like enzyme